MELLCALMFDDGGGAGGREAEGPGSGGIRLGGPDQGVDEPGRSKPFRRAEPHRVECDSSLSHEPGPSILRQGPKERRCDGAKAS